MPMAVPLRDVRMAPGGLVHVPVCPVPYRKATNLMTEATVASDSVDELRERLIGELRELKALRTDAVERAVRAVPRHLFLPEESVEHAYAAERSLVTKRDEHGIALSSVSAARIQTFMLEQAAIHPGMRVLEVGSGGLNAAYLAEMVGESGEVTTVDIDPEVTERAERLLEKAGYAERVRVVVVADAENGIPEHAPFDRIVVTVGAWDIPWAWVDQLAEKGRLVVPLRMRGLTRSVAFRCENGQLMSDDYEVCGFVPIQGDGAHREELLLVTGTNEIGLRFDDGLPSEPSLLDNAVRTPRAETWTGVVVGRWESFEMLQLYLATMLDGFCIMAVDPDLDTGLVAPSNKYFSLAAVDNGNFAYLTTRRTPDDKSVEFGVHAFGPQGADFAETVAGHVRAWDSDQRGGPGPRIAVYPATTPADQLPGQRVISKVHSRVTLSWPTAATRPRARPSRTTPPSKTRESDRYAGHPGPGRRYRAGRSAGDRRLRRRPLRRRRRVHAGCASRRGRAPQRQAHVQHRRQLRLHLPELQRLQLLHRGPGLTDPLTAGVPGRAHRLAPQHHSAPPFSHTGRDQWQHEHQPATGGRAARCSAPPPGHTA
jgi:protein-L-isoaspartate(D-aspartate) O-methyltransferase